MRKAEKLAGLPPYIFAQLDEKVYRLRESGVKDIVDLGKADPDHPTPEAIVKRLQETAIDPENHHYPAFRGSLFFREQVAKWYKARFGVNVDPEKEIITLIGSKEGLFHVSLAYIQQGDIGLVPDPAFPAYNDGVFFAGGETYPMKLTKENHFLPDLKSIPEDIKKRAKLMFVNYPNNPTGVTAPDPFIHELIQFAKENHVIVCYDNAYCEIYFDSNPPKSFLSFEGGKEVGVEFFTFSKAFNMSGWRLGAAIGNEEVINSLLVVQSHINSGVFTPIQFAGVTAMDQVWHTDFPEQNRWEYKRRRDYALEKFTSIGWDVHKPDATVYLWVPVPSGMTSLDFANRLLEEYAVVVAPGTAFGHTGEGYVRISLTTAFENVVKGIDRICEGITKWRK